MRLPILPSCTEVLLLLLVVSLFLELSPVLVDDNTSLPDITFFWVPVLITVSDPLTWEISLSVEVSELTAFDELNP